jgi:DUF438 domain-containing protein
MYWQRGSLTPEQVDLVIRHLPFDLSFADEHDVLVYWKGETYKTCDARYLGRDVRDCHPPAALPLLERILAEFKAGRRDVAEGWWHGRRGLRRTRYIAVRDRDGAYRGILEVNEDLGDPARFAADRALPGWDEGSDAAGG